jgi:hypothetical protein
VLAGCCHYEVMHHRGLPRQAIAFAGCMLYIWLTIHATYNNVAGICKLLVQLGGCVLLLAVGGGDGVRLASHVLWLS